VHEATPARRAKTILSKSGSLVVVDVVASASGASVDGKDTLRCSSLSGVRPDQDAAAGARRRSGCEDDGRRSALPMRLTPARS
jgi:hypothetical protein